MKVLIVGGGGREHALVWKLKRDDPTIELHAAPGNPGIEDLARCHPVRVTDVAALVALAERERFDVTLVGPEAPLAAGLVDAFRARGLPVFGPTRDAARIETSKRFAKELMLRAGVPTAVASVHTDPASAKRAVRDLGAPVVVKASGLAAGKGVFVCRTAADADEAIDSMLLRAALGDAGAEVLVEAFMEGEELSLFALTDGSRAIAMLPAQDHKRLRAGDEGPNTGGMGAYAPVSIGTPELVARALDDVFAPTLAALREHGCTFTGLLYAGLMVTDDGLKVVEFNCRFGDPETEAILPLLRSRLLDFVLPVARGGELSGAPELAFSDDAAVTTVVAAPGYPDSPVAAAPVDLPLPAPGVTVFHAGTARRADGRLVSAGGRVLAVTAVAPSLADAQRRSATAAAAVGLDGKQWRDDIGWRELRRPARAS